MAAPTRAQIEATYALPKYKVEIYTRSPSVWTQILDARVVSISGDTSATDNDSNAVAFGSPSDSSATVEVEDYAISGTYLSNPYWINRLVRISLGFDTSDFVVVYQGPITSIDKSNETITYNLGSSLDFLNLVKIHTPIYYRRPIATKTTIATQENPDLGGYVGGLLNLMLWRAGGRPLEQKGLNYNEDDYSWRFWYSLEQSLVTPDFTWLSGENAKDEIFSMVRATGGQLYQALDGVVRFVQPLSFGDITNYSSYYVFTDSVFDGYSEHLEAGEDLTKVSLTFTPRRVDPEQELIEDTTPRFFAPGEYKWIELAAQNPVWNYLGLIPYNQQTAVNNMQYFLLDGRVAIPYIYDIVTNAGQLTIGISNSDNDSPMVLNSIKIKGRPLGVADEQTATYDAGYSFFGYSDLPARNLENNPYVQNQAHAERLVRMYYDFYAERKATITLDNVQYDPDRYVGELVQLNTRYNLNNPALTIYRITSISHSNLGTTMSVGLVKVSALPSRDEMFIIGGTYAAGTVKKLSY